MTEFMLKYRYFDKVTNSMEWLKEHYSTEAAARQEMQRLLKKPGEGSIYILEFKLFKSTLEEIPLAWTAE
jgi:hypothetical protein